MKMIEINLKIDEEVIKELETSLMLKGACGNMHGTLDEFLLKLIHAIRNGWDGVTFKNIPMNKRGKKKRVIKKGQQKGRS